MAWLLLRWIDVSTTVLREGCGSLCTARVSNEDRKIRSEHLMFLKRVSCRLRQNDCLLVVAITRLYRYHTAIANIYYKCENGRDAVKPYNRPISSSRPESIEKLGHFVANVHCASFRLMEGSLSTNKETVRTFIREGLSKTKV
ncbi:hypothetical protein TNCV_4680051 [Trichonephila clavipes]|nr:hypothetical protein TNCV_4680051 [Trichonephila clavipes]